MKLALPTLALLTVALGACADRGADDASAPIAAPVAVEQAAETPPPVAVPAPADASLSPSANVDAGAGPLPAAGTITFSGFGPASFGADAEAVRQSWGSELEASPNSEATCYYLIPPSEPVGSQALSFMIENGTFGRLDVSREGVGAPGGGAIGMSIEQISALYPGVQQQNHKYVEGAKYLRVTDPAGGDGVLVFETEADGIVDEWRIGVPPQVDYVEGCS